jgi:hypothetical protein
MVIPLLICGVLLGGSAAWHGGGGSGCGGSATQTG